MMLKDMMITGLLHDKAEIVADTVAPDVAAEKNVTQELDIGVQATVRVPGQPNFELGGVKTGS